MIYSPYTGLSAFAAERWHGAAETARLSNLGFNSLFQNENTQPTEWPKRIVDEGSCLVDPLLDALDDKNLLEDGEEVRFRLEPAVWNQATFLETAGALCHAVGVEYDFILRQLLAKCPDMGEIETKDAENVLWGLFMAVFLDGHEDVWSAGTHNEAIQGVLDRTPSILKRRPLFLEVSGLFYLRTYNWAQAIVAFESLFERDYYQGYNKHFFQIVSGLMLAYRQRGPGARIPCLKEQWEARVEALHQSLRLGYVYWFPKLQEACQTFISTHDLSEEEKEEIRGYIKKEPLEIPIGLPECLIEEDEEDKEAVRCRECIIIASQFCNKLQHWETLRLFSDTEFREDRREDGFRDIRADELA